jgi:hypothetical protein
MTVTVLELNENEDGSANLVFEVDDPAYQKTLIEEGLNFVLLKAAFGVSTNEIVKMLEERAMTEVDNKPESV